VKLKAVTAGHSLQELRMLVGTVAFNPFPCFQERVACEERLHQEEVRVEYGREDDLVYDDLSSQ